MPSKPHATARHLRQNLATLALCLSLAHCSIDALDPPEFPDGGLLAQSIPPALGPLAALAGNYHTAGSTRFGDAVSVSVVRDHVSIFASNTVYAITRAGCLSDHRLILEGSWRRANALNTGLLRLEVRPAEVAEALCTLDTVIAPELLDSIALIGTLGEGSGEPSTPLSLLLRKPLKDMSNFRIVAHRGGCRTSDECGAAENSLEVLRMAEFLGANAVEIDTSITKDGVPIVYHDEAFSARLTQGNYCSRPINEFTLAHVRALCRLENGEQVPTLEEALTVILDETDLDGVWLDIKNPESIQSVIDVVAPFRARARAENRGLTLVYGLYSDDMIDAYLAATPDENAVCLIELDPADVRSANCQIWGPRWTRGPMSDKVARVQASGRAVAFWTLDELDFLDIILADAKPNGILTNRPGLVFQRFQELGTPPAGPSITLDGVRP